MNYDIEKVDNGFITKQDRGTGYKHEHLVFTTFEQLVENMALFYRVIKTGEVYRDKVFREESTRQQNCAR